MTDFDFQKQVIGRSFDIPVLVDFWAPSCGPCKFIEPVLQQLEARSEGKWKLIKINIEDDTELVEGFRIKSIPLIKLFYKGTEIASLTGVVPELELMAWLKRNLPDQIHEEWEKLKNELAPEELFFPNFRIQEFVSHYRNFEEAVLYLALSKVSIDPQFTYSVLSRLHPKAEFLDLREDIQALADLFSLPESDRKLSHILKTAKEAIKKRNLQEGVELLIHAVMLNRNYADELPRRSGVAIFRILGDSHPLTKKYRKRFDMALY